ncbi:MAG: response regulator [Blautia massiliensis (ex Durand et al. 2017)]
MKLLIVDDEELTRTGLISSIDWDSLGITEILQADDGVNGLEMARLYKPEIILCDVRMPRMTGIAMLERLEKFLPDSIPIFMSGYSDKEYLKAAIKLKAINYIEKPLHPEEVQAAVLESADSLQTKAPLPSWRSDPFSGNRYPAGTTADSSTFR